VPFTSHSFWVQNVNFDVTGKFCGSAGAVLHYGCFFLLLYRPLTRTLSSMVKFVGPYTAILYSPAALSLLQFHAWLECELPLSSFPLASWVFLFFWLSSVDLFDVFPGFPLQFLRIFRVFLVAFFMLLWVHCKNIYLDNFSLDCWRSWFAFFFFPPLVYSHSPFSRCVNLRADGAQF